MVEVPNCLASSETKVEMAVLGLVCEVVLGHRESRRNSKLTFSQRPLAVRVKGTSLLRMQVLNRESNHTHTTHTELRVRRQFQTIASSTNIHSHNFSPARTPTHTIPQLLHSWISRRIWMEIVETETIPSYQ